MADEGVLKHFRVTQIQVGLVSHTVTAASHEDALKKIAEGFGAHAGSEGPTNFAAIAQDRSILPTPPTLQSVITELMTAWQLLEAARQRARTSQPAVPLVQP